MIVDGDGHVAEPMTVWTDYLATEFYPRFHHARGPTGIEALIVEDHAMVQAVNGSPHLTSPDGNLNRRFSYGDSMTPRGILPGRARNRKFEEGHPGGSIPAERLQVHDQEGLEAAVLFTTLGLWVGSIRDPSLAVAVCQALNRWLGDFCAVAPKELFGVATLPVQDPAGAAMELRRCAEQYGFVAGTIRPNPAPDGTTVADQSLDPVWTEAQDLGVPICFHSGANGWHPFLGRDRGQDSGCIAHNGSRIRADGCLRRVVRSGSVRSLPSATYGFHGEQCRLGPVVDRPARRARGDLGMDLAAWREAEPGRSVPRPVRHRRGG